MHYLYRITNTVKSKVYIGQTINPASRWYRHKADSAYPKQVLHFAIKKYGNENFIFEVIACCLTQDNANYLEIELIKQYDSRNQKKGYNINEGGFGGKLSDEAQKRATESRKKYILIHPEHYENIAEKLKGNTNTIGVLRSEETKQKMSKSHKGKTWKLIDGKRHYS